MRALAIALLIASVSCKREENIAARADPEAKKGAVPAAIVIRKKAPPVGLRVREEKKLDLAFSFQIGATKTATEKHETSTRLEEVLASEGYRATKLRVTYEAREDKSNLTGGSVLTTAPSPVVGKTYVVELADAGVAVTEPGGARPPPDELVIVESDYRSAEDDMIARGIPDTPLRAGDAVPTLANALRNRVLGTGSRDVEGDIDVKVDSFAKAGSEVVFKIKATFTLGPTKMTVPMTGTMTVRVDGGWLDAYEMKGELKMTGDAGLGLTDGQGTTTLSAKRTYLP